MVPIVVCTVGSPSLKVLEASVAAYTQADLFIDYNQPSNFGDAYNAAMARAFETHDEIIIANDDIVLTPTSLSLLLEDVEWLKSRVNRLGLVSATADNVRSTQKPRTPVAIYRASRVSPLFCWVSKEAFSLVKFPPINWWSDDVMSEDLNGLGFENYISRSYVHHAGSMTVGTNYTELNASAWPWVIKNRPEYVTKWTKES